MSANPKPSTATPSDGAPVARCGPRPRVRFATARSGSSPIGDRRRTDRWEPKRRYLQASADGLYGGKLRVGVATGAEALREGWAKRRFTADELLAMAKASRVHDVPRPYLDSVLWAARTSDRSPASVPSIRTNSVCSWLGGILRTAEIRNRSKSSKHSSTSPMGAAASHRSISPARTSPCFTSDSRSSPAKAARMISETGSASSPPTREARSQRFTKWCML